MGLGSALVQKNDKKLEVKSNNFHAFTTNKRKLRTTYREFIGNVHPLTISDSFKNVSANFFEFVKFFFKFFYKTGDLYI